MGSTFRLILTYYPIYHEDAGGGQVLYASKCIPLRLRMPRVVSPVEVWIENNVPIVWDTEL